MKLLPTLVGAKNVGDGQIQKPPRMENRLLLGTAASGWAIVLPNWKRLLLLNVVPPPAITPRVMVNRALLCAKAASEMETHKTSSRVFMVLIRLVINKHYPT